MCAYNTYCAPVGTSLHKLCRKVCAECKKSERPAPRRGNDLKWLPLSSCGTQHPHRALGGTRVLLAAAPTTPPCFRRWRRSSSLHSGHIQRKNYFKFRVCRALRSATNAFSQMGSQGQTAFAVPASYGSGGTAGRILSRPNAAAQMWTQIHRSLPCRATVSVGNERGSCRFLLRPLP